MGLDLGLVLTGGFDVLGHGDLLCVMRDFGRPPDDDPVSGALSAGGRPAVPADMQNVRERGFERAPEPVWERYFTSSRRGSHPRAGAPAVRRGSVCEQGAGSGPFSRRSVLRAAP
ncbi:hypothetical protein GCM10010406_44390 [Streptomyces thermolineatus]|uniref:Uncharacterized protein n=1 Tax=Streptomyces thermolineatus TaxID=44033 RepID=A0ABP5ZXZ1_9ACTN